MAKLTQPNWQPNPVTKPSIVTTVRYDATRRSAASGLEVTYKLLADNPPGHVVRFAPAASAEENDNTEPKPTSQVRDPLVIVDRFEPFSPGDIPVIRGLGIVVAPGVKNGFATVEVTVTDLGRGDSECNTTACRKEAMIRIAIP